MRQPSGRTILGSLVVFFAYYLAGRIGLAVPYTSGNVSPIWPAAGIALAGFLLLDYRICLGVALAAFAVNFGSVPFSAAAAIAIGNSLGPMLGAALLTRNFSRKISLRDLPEILRFVVLGCLCGTALTATIGSFSLYFAGVNPWRNLASAWTIWWLGDAMGVLLLTPLALHIGDLHLRGARSAEFIVLQLALFVCSGFVFTSGLLTEQIFGFALLPFVIWGAVRFGVAGAALSSCVVSAIAVWATASGIGPFVRYGTPLQNATVLQAFVAVLCLSGLILAVVVSERQNAQRALEREEQLRKTADVLRRSEKWTAAGKLAATISHEINNPLEAVKNLLYLLQSQISTAEARHLLEMAQHEVRRVSEISRRTLGFFRESSKPAQVDLRNLIEDSLSVYGRAIADKNISLVRDYSQQSLALLRGGEIQQVFSNLIANALDAMSDEGVLQISIRETQVDGMPGFEIELRDSGSGIEQRDLSRIFEPFFTTKENSGTGLGLWVSKEIIEKHGGRISVASKAGTSLDHGTRFTIFLPRECDTQRSAGLSA